MKIWLMSIMLILFTGCFSNPEIPAGFEGYVYESPRFFGKGGFEKIIKGPGNNGFSFFRYQTINIDMRAQTYKESFKILAKDKVNMTLDSQIILSLKPNTGKSIVEKFGGVEWYARNIQRVFRNLVRSNTTLFPSGVLKDKRSEIQQNVLNELTNYLKNTPFLIKKLVIGNIDFPEKIVSEIENRVALEEKEKAMDIRNKIAEKEANVRITEAKGIAKAQRIIDKSLTTNYLQYEAIKAQKEMANSPNHTTVYIPVGENGIPIMKKAK